jgi:hypothetical protein
METPTSIVKKTSLFLGALIGYGLATIVGAILSWIIAVRVGNFDNRTAFTLLVSLSAAGAHAGYRFAARQRKRLGVNEPSDEWEQFVGSWTFNVLAVIVLAGSLAISTVTSLLYDVVFGAPWLGNS